MNADGQTLGTKLSPAETPRNIATSGGPLNHLVDQEFWVGQVLLRSARLCEPCRHQEDLTQKGVLVGLIHRGGLRARILTEGTIHVGDVIRPPARTGAGRHRAIVDELTLVSHSSSTGALLASWRWRPEVVLILATLASVYASGWWRLREWGYRELAPGWRLGLYLSGLGAVAVALLPPVDDLADVLLTAHMVQHLILMMIAAPLLLLGNPLPTSLWGLPWRARRALGRLLTRNAPLRKVLWAATLMPVAWLLFVGNLWLWHLPAAYQAALRDPVIHDVEHVAFFGTALLFWWPIVEPAPRLHERIPRGFAILYLLAATGQNTLLSALIALPERVLYPYYEASRSPLGVSALDDQALAGGLMWSMGHMYLVPILLVVARMLDREERTARQREAMRGDQPRR